MKSLTGLAYQLSWIGEFTVVTTEGAGIVSEPGEKGWMKRLRNPTKGVEPCPKTIANHWRTFSSLLGTQSSLWVSKLPLLTKYRMDFKTRVNLGEGWVEDKRRWRIQQIQDWRWEDRALEEPGWVNRTQYSIWERGGHKAFRRWHSLYFTMRELW